jgi:hypothetical protein
MSDYSDLDRQIEQLKRCEIIKENEVKVLCAKAREILIEESNVQRVDSPVTVSFFLSSFLIALHLEFYVFICIIFYSTLLTLYTLNIYNNNALYFLLGVR